MTPIEAATGPMFSGKSGVLTEQIKRRIIGGQEPGKDFLSFNHHSDKRYGENVIGDHNGEKITAVALQDSLALLETLFNLPQSPRPLDAKDIKKECLGLKAIYLDEAQFFDQELPVVLREIERLFRTHPKREHPLLIMVAGLDLDFRGEPFGCMPEILARADRVTKYVAVCTGCGENKATLTQRLIDGQPANYDDPIILVGGKDEYTARCPDCHQIPNKPSLKFSKRESG